MSIISVQGLCKSFGSLEVLKDVDLTVEEGEVIAIIGGSGCGKSVFLRSIELLEKPDAGNITICGEEITASGANIDSIRRKMGMVYQNFNLFSHLNVMENLCLAPVRLLGMKKEDAEAKAHELLKSVSLENRADSMPGVLSGGQKQRIAIARCLMMDPKVMLFDEPTSALDPTMVGEVLATIRQLAKKGMTMLIVTHEMKFARDVSNRVLFLAEKGIYEQGTPDQLFNEPQKKLTQAFIRKLKTFFFHIASEDFDLMKLQGGIIQFCEKYGIDNAVSKKIQLLVEETVYLFLAGAFSDNANISIDIDVEYGETTGETKIDFFAKGSQYNPLEDKTLHDDSGMGIKILKNSPSNIEYKYEEGTNLLSVTV